MKLFFLTVPSVAPTLGEIIRISATEIQVRWSAILDNTAGVMVDTYLVKYWPLPPQRLQKRLSTDLATIIETNRTDYLISGLGPGFSYAVSVAAGNRAGVGNYSQEVVIGCEFSKSIYHLHYCI